MLLSGRTGMSERIKFRHGVASDALTILWNGLEHLNAQVVAVEDAQSKLFKGWIGGGTSAWDHRDQLLPSYFAWYATSAFSFLTLFSKTNVRNGHPADNRIITQEVQREFPQLVTWRHKIGAHFAFVFDRNDTETTRENSILLLIDFEIDAPNRGRFWVGTTVFKEPSQGVCADWRWSLTREHERISRYVRTYV